MFLTTNNNDGTSTVLGPIVSVTDKPAFVLWVFTTVTDLPPVENLWITDVDSKTSYQPSASDFAAVYTPGLWKLIYTGDITMVENPNSAWTQVATRLYRTRRCRLPVVNTGPRLETVPNPYRTRYRQELVDWRS